MRDLRKRQANRRLEARRGTIGNIKEVGDGRQLISQLLSCIAPVTKALFLYSNANHKLYWRPCLYCVSYNAVNTVMKRLGSLEISCYYPCPWL